VSKNTQPTKIERTGDKSFNVHHDDGSIFECKADSKERLNNIPGCKPKMFFVGGIGERKPLFCDNCKERVYKIQSRDGRSLCDRCIRLK